jgi:hemolysin activation/secretion protein
MALRMRRIFIGSLLLAQAFFVEAGAAAAGDPQNATPPPAAGEAATPKPTATPAFRPGTTPSAAEENVPAANGGQPTPANKEGAPASGTPAPDQKPPAPAESPAPPAGTPEGTPKPGAPGGATPEKSPGPDAVPPSSTPPAVLPLPPLPVLPPLPALPAPPPVPGDNEALPKPTLPSIEPMAPGSELLLIPNGILPYQRSPLIPTPDVMGFKPPPALPPAVEILKPEEMTIPVSKFNLRYALSPGQKAGPPLPPIDQLQKAAATLVGSNGVLIAPPTKPVAGSTVSVRLDETPAKPRLFRGDAIEKLGQAVVSLINKAGVYAVYVIPDPAQIDRGKKQYDQRGGKTDLSLLIYVSRFLETRSLRQKPGAGTVAPPVIDDPRDKRLLAKSPVGGRSGSSLLVQPALQNYLERVNRFPGRDVETEITPAGGQQNLILDFVVHEDKPLSIYAETQNSGTDSTGDWRTRLGLEEKQFLRLDDVLRAEYVGAHLSNYYAGLLSYEFAPIFPDYLKFKGYGAFAKFSSADIGYSLQDFESSTWIAGGQFTWTPVYIKGFPLDLSMGFQWMHVEVDHHTSDRDGRTDFALPYVGISTDRQTAKFTLNVNAQVEFNWFRLAGTPAADLSTLGRADADRHFTLATWHFTGSVFLEPLIFGKEWEEQKVWWKSTRAHELAVSFHGQAALNKSRLPPELEMTVGGFDTVRGYPEALTTGDSVMVASAEYRFHVPREFFKFGGGGRGDARETQIPDAPILPPKPGSILDPRFNSRATSLSSQPDWDVILRGFFDFGETFNYKIDPETERNRTLASVGGGVEFQFYKPLLVILRMDVGCPLITERDALAENVDHGGVRFHFSGSIAW